ncbi:MAG: diguanylate cyclase [Planctomycetia bacterium]|nr:diguanylate cyclase [Planctomycetia bacterium]
MIDPQSPATHYTQASTDDGAMPPTAPWTSELDTLLAELEEATDAVASTSVVDRVVDDQLVQMRLGIAASLFAVLRCKHPPTAAHMLRVALTTSAWCLKLGLDEAQRDTIEVAALLHDLGVNGIPDRILCKPGILSTDEALTVERSRRMSAVILGCSCTDPAVLDVVRNVSARYDGARPGYSVLGEAIPLGARMIAIVESFDAMTTDRVFRKAISTESAIHELFRCAGTQFDPELVEKFAEFQAEDQSTLWQDTTNRWLRTLDPMAVESYARFGPAAGGPAAGDVEGLFHARLTDNMHDAVVFVDASLMVKSWNHGAERMTGIPSTSVRGRQWLPQLLNLRDEKGDPVSDTDCPVAATIQSGVQSLRRLSIWGRNGRPISVDSHVIPVLTDDGSVLGAVLLLHDASSEISLEERCQSLHEKAIRDPLTRVANRAEFERVHEMFTAAHVQRRLPCSLIMCDLDHFKQVNDTYGHQAGDDVIKSLAGVLKKSCRSGDLVARYGGEEFVILCADCDNAAATARAEEARERLAEISQPRMGGRTITASFGVTEIQPGDNPETMLRRADRALLMAKGRGRNRVVQLGTGVSRLGHPLEDDVWSTLPESDGDRLFRRQFVTSVPMGVALEKLRGFVADHRATIVEVAENNMRLRLEHHPTDQRRRAGDRSTTFVVDLRFEEEFRRWRQPGDDWAEASATAARVPRTRIYFAISPRSNRERRHEETLARAREVLVSFRSYLMATEEVPGEKSPDAESNIVSTPMLDAWAIAPDESAFRALVRQATAFLMPWR